MLRRPSRRSPRWFLHDYRQGGLYFVTICVAGCHEMFGEVRQRRMEVSDLGRIAAEEWTRTLDIREALVPDAFVVMPNHVHLLFGILDAPEASGGSVPGRDAVPDADAVPGDTMHGVPTVGNGGALRDRGAEPIQQFGQHDAGSVSSIAGAYKAAVTRTARRQGLWHDGPLWQGRFHDRVVRSAPDAGRIRRYILDNPARWDADRFHPNHDPYP